MKWALGAMLAALAATVTINVLLLGYGGTRHDPVGRLSPVANLPLVPAAGTTTSPAITTPVITIPGGGDDKHSGSADD
jgi:hypothetical protein